ncbi:MAG: GntR family transcriptional regulator [Thermomicrobiales bacterium]
MVSQLERNASAPLYRQLATVLRRSIASGEARPGDRLPSESQLIGSYAVSRITVRQALAELEREGLVERSAGRGTFVREPRRPVPWLPKLSGFGDLVRAAGMTPGYEVIEAGWGEPPDAIRAEFGGDAGPAWLVERVLLADGAAVGMHESWLPGPIVASDPVRFGREALETGSLFAALDAVGAPAHRAVEQPAPAMASARQARLLGMPHGALLQRIARRVFDRTGRLVLAESDHYRPDAYAYRIELVRE